MRGVELGANCACPSWCDSASRIPGVFLHVGTNQAKVGISGGHHVLLRSRHFRNKMDVSESNLRGIP